MKKEENTPFRFDSLSQIHRMYGLPKPVHPLISLIDSSKFKLEPDNLPGSHISDFYKISYKHHLQGKLKYGQDYYDFEEGGMLFVAPNQVSANGDNNGDHTGYTLIFHPDFLLTYSLAKKIKRYGFFSYAANEALHLSDKEKTTIISIFKNIEEELQSRIDDFSQDVIISQIELLLHYSNRFYNRQFITRKAVNNGVLLKTEEILEQYFNDEKLLLRGIPTVQYLSEQLNISPGYLGDMLRTLTGQNAQQHIHSKLIEKAKEKLAASDSSISEIAYELGFEYAQSFSRFFKTKTNLSPLAFRQSFN